MVKPDVKHNYYADLELPTNASIDDIRKAYRKLALQYHPDRNAGREDEVVPKFQAIQAANEVLGDPNIKQKYDTDRRKVGLYPAFPPRQPTPTNPYAATSAYPPPPRRTGPGAGAFPRQPPAGAPPPGGPAAGAANGAMPGADRFSNFPRTSAKKDPAQDRTNMFKAWQNMNSTERPPPRFTQSTSQPPPQPPPQAPPQPHAGRPRPPPPPRQEPKVPPEPGPKYKVPPPFDPEAAEKRQSAWSAFQQANAGRPGMARSNTFKTPKKAGFDPNAPGSDERPAPAQGANPYAHHKNKSADFARARPNVNVPPPPPGAPPAGTPGTGPTSPTSPRSQRPHANPLHPFDNLSPDDQVPYAEGNRVRTPYTRSFIGEKTDFSGEGLRRSHSTHDTTKLSADDAANRGRARSSSPQHKAQSKSPQFRFYSSGESSGSDEGVTQTPDDIDSSNSQDPKRPGTAPFDRPKKTPTPPSRRYNGPTSPPPPMPGMPNPDGATDGVQSEHRQSDMHRKSSSNMYAHPSHFPFSPHTWTSRMFGSYSTSRVVRGSLKIPNWAIPSSVNPSLRAVDFRSQQPDFVTAADEVFINATKEEQNAYLRFQSELRKNHDNVPEILDMDVFLKLAKMARKGELTGNEIVDRVLSGVLHDFDSVGFAQNHMADNVSRGGSFTFPNDPNMFETSNTAKSRSEENINTSNINTSFTPEGWTGTFTGDPDYFAPPTGPSRKQPSRAASSKTATSQRSATMDVPPPNSAPHEEIPQRPWGSDGTPSEYPRSAAPFDTGFNTEEWQRKFHDDPTWTWPPPPPNPPSPVKGTPAPRGRKASKASARKGAGTKSQPHVLDEDDTVEVEGADGRPEMGAPVDDGDAMDIDNTPPAQQTPATGHENGARVYSVPPSQWRLGQEEKTRGRRKSTSASRRSQQHAKLHTNLDDLRHVEPLAQNTSTTGGFNLSDMSSTLPFPSQASTSVGDQQHPRNLELPPHPQPPHEPQKLTKTSWHAYASAFGEYVKAFHTYNRRLLRHFESREHEVQHSLSAGMEWLEATGDTTGRLTGPSGFGTYARGVKEDEKVRESWNLAWEKHGEFVRSFQLMRDRVRKLAVAGLMEN